MQNSFRLPRRQVRTFLLLTAVIGIFALTAAPASAAPVGRAVYTRCFTGALPDTSAGYYWGYAGSQCAYQGSIPQGGYYTLYQLQNSPDGFVDGLDRGVIFGWARDLDAPTTPLNLVLRVDVPGDDRGYYDYTTITANLFRPDLGGNAAFHFVHGLPPGTKVKIRALDVHPGGGIENFNHYLRPSNAGVRTTSNDHTYIVP